MLRGGPRATPAASGPGGEHTPQGTAILQERDFRTGMRTPSPFGRDSLLQPMIVSSVNPPESRSKPVIGRQSWSRCREVFSDGMDSSGRQ